MLLAALIARLREWSLRRETRRELSRRSDRELADMGIDRARIDEIARGLKDAPRLG